jgi:hypothetical protein
MVLALIPRIGVLTRRLASPALHAPQLGGAVAAASGEQRLGGVEDSAGDDIEVTLENRVRWYCMSAL